MLMLSRTRDHQGLHNICSYVTRHLFSLSFHPEKQQQQQKWFELPSRSFFHL